MVINWGYSMKLGSVERSILEHFARHAPRDGETQRTVAELMNCAFDLEVALGFGKWADEHELGKEYLRTCRMVARRALKSLERKGLVRHVGTRPVPIPSDPWLIRSYQRQSAAYELTAPGLEAAAHALAKWEADYAAYRAANPQAAAAGDAAAANIKKNREQITNPGATE